jgi:hypothetical protein
LNTPNDFNIYFNDSGVIDITDKNRKRISLFKNNLTNNNNSDTTISNLVTLKNKTNKYIFSKPFGKYVLYLPNKNDVSLRYNPVPRPEYSKYANSTNRKTATDYVIETCFETNLEEPFCSCIQRINTSNDNDTRDRQFCMNELLGSENLRKIIEQKQGSAYNDIAKNCDCSNPSCGTDHPYRLRLRELIGTCPSNLVVTICNTSFDAGSKLQTGDVNVQQKCGAEVGIGQTEQPPSTPNLAPVTGSTYTSDKPPSSTTPTTTSSTTSISPTSTTPTKTSSTTSSIVPPKKKVPVPIQTNNTLYIVIFIVVILIAIISYFMLKSPSQRFYKRHF